jgi:hypothetical protein
MAFFEIDRITATAGADLEYSWVCGGWKLGCCLHGTEQED